MDEREGDQGGVAGERPLTRREIRAAQAGAQATGHGVDDPGPLGPLRPFDAGEPVGPREADSWEAAVGWARPTRTA